MATTAPDVPAPPPTNDTLPLPADDSTVAVPEVAAPSDGSTGSVLRAATTNITSLLSTARTKAVEASASVAESATTLVHAASARIQAQRVSHTGPGATKNGSETAEAGGLPPSSAPGTAAEGIEHHRTTMQAVTPLLEAAAGFTRKTRDSSVAAYQAAVQGIRRLTAPTRRVAAVVKADLRVKPVPHTLLLTCNRVAAVGMDASLSLFSEPGPDATSVTALAARLEDSVLLLPPEVDAVMAAAVAKHFLTSLEEPLLTYKLCERWVGAGKALVAGDASHIPLLLSELPLVNWSTLRLLSSNSLRADMCCARLLMHTQIETCFHLASRFNVTGLNSLALATRLTPALLWYERPPGTSAATAAGPLSSSGASSMVNQASQMAAATLQALRSKLGHTGAAEAGSDGTAAPSALSPPASSGAVTVPPADATATTAAPKPHVVLDEDEFLDLTITQHSAAATAAAEAATTTATTAVPATTAAGGALAPTPLTAEALEAVIAVVEHLILSFEDVFVVHPATV